MNRIDRNRVFVKINTQIKETSVLTYIKNKGMEKENNCAECGIYCGNSVDCYPCLLANAKSRNELDSVIAKNKSDDIYKYIYLLQQHASKHNDLVSKRLSDIVESAMYLKLL